MREMTSRQKEYLLLFAQQSNNDRFVANVSEVMGISKATVSRLSTLLRKRGYLRKESLSTIALTEAGQEYVMPMLTQVRRLEELMMAMGTTPELAESEARRMVATLESETIDRMISYLLRNIDATVMLVEKADRFFCQLPAGKYEVPFQLCKKGTQEPSMGDRGFQKPALLVRSKDSCCFLIRTLEIQCKVHEGLRSDKGTVKRMWFHSENAWYELEAYQSSTYEVPAFAVQCRETVEGVIGRAHIRVRPTVSLLKMPDSDADLVFLLKDIRPIKDIEVDLWQRKRGN